MNNGTHPIVYNGSRTVYLIFSGSAPSELVTTDTKTVTWQLSGTLCQSTTVWSPAEPRLTFNDPGLP
jgi:hypothetical protein